MCCIFFSIFCKLSNRGCITKNTINNKYIQNWVRRASPFLEATALIRSGDGHVNTPHQHRHNNSGTRLT